MNILFKNKGTMYGRPICDIHADLYNYVWDDGRLCKKLKNLNLGIEISSVRISSIFYTYIQHIC